MAEGRKHPDCLSCRYFSVTWDPRFPRSCSVFGVKSRLLPSVVVFRATGHICPSYERSPKVRSDS
ncbi:hypothetical protein [Sediminispirochaeta smaragdinae]|uniref:Uracil-DNA glycosylase n=1 Tax=Sediminispirochaeta smaragdinae (strain DSM 11293 / JCM 15392 / SEBR 4228) TaxID=573413 RepID=E1R4R8_SEDSS|nr:hypothetical protein [Sediminispirochaeta smaragdinae]ADK82156.1 hypothetical protein Spirs_3055 [Sediminispirochaeta smaragdinae DSM 11293]